MYMKLKINLCSKRYVSIFALVTLVLVNSCRKDQNQTQLAAETNGARSWYLNQNAHQVSYLKSSAGDSVALSSQPDWENTTKISLEDQSTAYAIPVRTNLYSITGKRGSLMLIIRKKNNAYSSRFISIDAKKGSVDEKTRLAKLDFSKICSQAFAEKDESKLKFKNSSVAFANSSADKLAVIYPAKSINSSSPGRDVPTMAIICTEWVLVTDYYVDGVWVGSTEQVIGITCSGNGGGGHEGVLPDYGGGGDPVEEESKDCSESVTNLSGVITNELEGVTLGSSDANTRTQYYAWVIYKQNWGLWKFTSHEKGVHIFINNEWRWQSLTHENITLSGFAVGGTLECNVINSLSEIGLYNALMVLNCNFRGTAVCKGIPVSYSKDFPARKLLNVND